ncbi:DNA-binding PadR family transcriptional regulator [Psychromicrobium silvestre]|uniref:DNA-binding PadR family transcriptional regulator n=1 Tax=Psychromicrobium silvestre TaxID=1645614 RepID=A0A7Y9LVQ1_9MICC|nr:PadR family transcriptional regulator [Psychromicrobium silvestre]NYE96492.1 DNA-binding PadR family transcriptional regulator [Psychromicrobium silvestre]
MRTQEHHHEERRFHHDPRGLGDEEQREPRGRGRGPRRGGFNPGGPHRGRGFGPGFGPGFGFGPAGRAKKGDVRSAILSLLSQSSYNGYGLIKAIAVHSDGAWRPSPGSVYPALTQLQSEGLIVSVGEGRRTEFELTETGRNHVAEHQAELAAVWEEVNEEAGAAQDLRLSVGKLMGAVHQIGLDGSEEQLRTVTAALDEARRTIYKLLSD